MELKGYPSNLDEAIETVIDFGELTKDKLANLSENEFVSNLHFSYGMFIRNEWFLWWQKDHEYENWPIEKPELVAFFNDIGIFHADDMSGIIFTSVYRHLKGIEINLDEQVEIYKEHWRKNGFKDGIFKIV